MSNGGPVQNIANLAKGQDRGNAVTIQVISLFPAGRNKKLNLIISKLN